MHGDLTTEAFDYDGKRNVSAYIPANAARAIVFCGDGELISSWGEDIEAAGLPPTMVVGVHHVADETLRLNEYSPGFDPARFNAHEDFLINEVRSWASSRFGVALPVERTAVFGVSAGGELALALGIRNSNIFGAILSASPGAGYRPPNPMPQQIPRTYLVAGENEPFFLENAQRWANALQDNGNDVVMVQRNGGHDEEMWRIEFPRMVSWAFGFSRNSGE